ncbi:hypothetical protein GCM10010123_02030 [Pilimelia anulata]|uniref:Uncharacterized protein n=1 Tax=Pilimelia anulata TaxID=53371 RepID=A0A8J3F758_9ACTN|nr:hypothetical protein GCM10010123_02030 [Pilimelia anulata]
MQPRELCGRLSQEAGRAGADACFGLDPGGGALVPLTGRRVRRPSVTILHRGGGSRDLDGCSSGPPRRHVRRLARCRTTERGGAPASGMRCLAPRGRVYVAARRCAGVVPL